ncbi:hypothetical protein HPP92_000026 [Vanilla planifolia]|uniref:Uncharacterized protein n=1 Tax=Vanilla planifolia TaxID=51239 RepID=A0A835RN16_VANPL|nr:hypothetical protein HPP92_000026 [Vanilla planifolia]
MVSGFAKAERIMKCLYVWRLNLWLRFHVLLCGDLERDAPEVVDVRDNGCLSQGAPKANKVDVEDLTVENGLFKSFDEFLRRQLNPIWHTLGKKTKQLVSDLSMLRKLLDYLLRYDAVTYLKYLDTLRVSEGVRSVWIFAESSCKIFELAKKHVFQVVLADGVRSSSGRKIMGHQRSVTRDSANVKEAG